ncbi:Hypothetical_protein [Hexamita inflata]|uniref:Hypothetical_protein n=1 Tax=Hexamita inflata TaxID=28002 RepID=A0AA86QY99_9EUKA|nr:Hypothetical protein HINF_LOCUS54500 [Hexamita inflata]
MTQQMQYFIKDNDDDHSLRIMNKLKLIPKYTREQVFQRYIQIIVNEIQKETSEQANNYKDLFIIIFKSIQILNSKVKYQLVPCLIHTYILHIAVVPKYDYVVVEPLIMTQPGGKSYFKDSNGELLHTIPYTHSGNIIHHINANQFDNRLCNLVTTFNNKLVAKEDYKIFISRAIWKDSETRLKEKKAILKQTEDTDEADEKKLNKIKINCRLSDDEYQTRIDKSWQGNVAYSQHKGLHKILQTFHSQLFFENCFELNSDLNLEPSFYTTYLEDFENLNDYEQYSYMLDNTYSSSFIFSFDKFYEYVVEKATAK